MSESKKKFNRSDIASFLAVALSIAALAIGVMETQIMSEQQHIMAEQQKASVWPYVEVKTNMAITDKIVITCSAENKGVGPAIIKEGSILFQNEQFNNSLVFRDFLIEYLGEPSFDLISFGLSPNMKSVFKPGERKEMFRIILKNPEDIAKVGTFVLDLNYCSIYNDCWKSNGQEIPIKKEVD